MNSNYAFVTPSPHTLPYLPPYLLKLHVFVRSIICNVSYTSQFPCVQGQGHGPFCWLTNVHAWSWLPTYLWNDCEGGRRGGWVGQAWPPHRSLYVSAGRGFLRSGVSLAKHISDGQRLQRGKNKAIKPLDEKTGEYFHGFGGETAFLSRTWNPEASKENLNRLDYIKINASAWSKTR